VIFCVLLFGVVYWPNAVSQWIRQGNSVIFCTNLGKSATETLAMIRQAFSKELNEPCTESPNSPRLRNARQANSKLKSILIIFLQIEIVPKEFLLAGQTINFVHYCDVLRRLRGNVRRLLPELWRQKNWLSHHDNAPFHASVFTRESLTKNNMTLVSYPSYFSLFP
jgi:hypothetical protein